MYSSWVFFLPINNIFVWNAVKCTALFFECPSLRVFLVARRSCRVNLCRTGESLATAVSGMKKFSMEYKSKVWGNRLFGIIFFQLILHSSPPITYNFCNSIFEFQLKNQYSAVPNTNETEFFIVLHIYVDYTIAIHVCGPDWSHSARKFVKNFNAAKFDSDSE